MDELNLSKYKVWMFDLDGTILDSMGEKAESFALATIKVNPETITHKDRIKEIYIETKGTPRSIQLSLVLHELGYPPLSDEELTIWSEYFSQYYLPTKPNTFVGSVELLKKLKKQGKKIVLSTGAPQSEAEEVVVSNNLDLVVDLAMGHVDSEFSKGKGHFQKVLREFGVEKKDIIFVGDGAKDVQIAKNSSIDCIGVINNANTDSRENLKKANPNMIVENISDLTNLIE